MSTSTVPPTVALGVDIGAKAIHVATSGDPRSRVTVIELSDHDWHNQLAAFVSPGETVAAYEPTGWHYSAPIVATLQHAGATLLQVEHRITGIVRDLKVSGVKKDKTDAHALATIAARHHLEAYRGVHQVQTTDLLLATNTLRALVWSYIRTDKETVRTTNRLRQMAHSIWPSLSKHLGPYLVAIQTADAITPAELRSLARRLAIIRDEKPAKGERRVYPYGYEEPATRTALHNLVETLPLWLDWTPLRPVIQRESFIIREQEARQEDAERLIIKALQTEHFAQVADLWLTVPGAGHIAIASILAACHGDPTSISLRQFKASLGSHPRLSQSGETEESSAARQGFKPAKKYLYLWTMALLNPDVAPANNPIRATFDDRRGEEHAIRRARAKLCAILHGIARSGQPYDPNYAAQEEN